MGQIAIARAGNYQCGNYQGSRQLTITARQYGEVVLPDASTE